MSRPAPPGSAIAALERWEAHGASWRVLSITERLAVVELSTCHGEPVDQIRSGDPAFLTYLAERA